MEIIQLKIAEALHIGRTYGEDLQSSEVIAVNGFEVFTDNKHMDILCEFTADIKKAETFKGTIAEAVEIQNAKTFKRIELIVIKKIRAKTKEQIKRDHKYYLEVQIATYIKSALQLIKELEQCK